MATLIWHKNSCWCGSDWTHSGGPPIHLFLEANAMTKWCGSSACSRSIIRLIEWLKVCFVLTNGDTAWYLQSAATGITDTALCIDNDWGVSSWPWEFCTLGKASRPLLPLTDVSQSKIHWDEIQSTLCVLYHHHHHHHLALQPFVGFRPLSQVSTSSSTLSCLLPVFNFQLFF